MIGDSATQQCISMTAVLSLKKIINGFIEEGGLNTKPTADPYFLAIEGV